MTELLKANEQYTGMETRHYAKEPSFLAVVAMSGVVLILLFVGIVLLLSTTGAEILPNIHKPDSEPTSMLVMPARAPTTGGQRA
jgi:hypothetical protein